MLTNGPLSSYEIKILIPLPNHRYRTYLYTHVLICIQLFATPWTVAHQAPLSMGFFRQEYWNKLPFPPPGDVPDPGIEFASPESPALVRGFFTTEPLGKPLPMSIE